MNTIAQNNSRACSLSKHQYISELGAQSVFHEIRAILFRDGGPECGESHSCSIFLFREKGFFVLSDDLTHDIYCMNLADVMEYEDLEYNEVRCRVDFPCQEQHDFFVRGSCEEDSFNILDMQRKRSYELKLTEVYWMLLSCGSLPSGSLYSQMP